MGLPRFKGLDLSIKATKVASSLSDSIKVGTGGSFDYERIRRVDIEAEEKFYKEKLTSRLDRMERKMIIGELNSIKELKNFRNRSRMKINYKPKRFDLVHPKLKEICTSTSEVKESRGYFSVNYESTYPVLVKSEVVLREKVVEIDFLKAMKMNISKELEDVREKIKIKGVRSLLDKCKILNTADYAKSLNESNGSLRSRVKHLEQLGRYNGFEPKFPVNPITWHRTGKHILKSKTRIKKVNLPISIENSFSLLSTMQEEENASSLNLKGMPAKSNVCIMNTWKRFTRATVNMSKSKKKKNEKYMRSRALKKSKIAVDKKRKIEALSDYEDVDERVRSRLKVGANDVSRKMRRNFRNVMIDLSIIRNESKIKFKEFMEKNKSSIIYRALMIGDQSPAFLKTAKEHASEKGFPNY